MPGMPSLTIGRINVPFPIIQGGMAVKVSTARLAAAVATEGGIGIIAGTAMSPAELRKEIASARKMIKGPGALGVNILLLFQILLNLSKLPCRQGLTFLLPVQGYPGICIHGEDSMELSSAYSLLRQAGQNGGKIGRSSSGSGRC